MRNTISEMREKTLGGIISRLETTEENISQLGNKAIDAI